MSIFMGDDEMTYTVTVSSPGDIVFYISRVLRRRPLNRPLWLVTDVSGARVSPGEMHVRITARRLDPDELNKVGRRDWFPMTDWCWPE